MALAMKARLAMATDLAHHAPDGVHSIPGHAEDASPGSPGSARQARAKPRSVKAYQLLADQPASLAGLSAEDRAQVVVSAVLDDEGQSHVISRVGDLEWNLWPFVSTPNT